jgi:hypothetical protein
MTLLFEASILTPVMPLVQYATASFSVGSEYGIALSGGRDD